MECLSHFCRVIGSIRMREIVSFALCATVCVWICRSIRKTARWTRSESSSCFACTRVHSRKGLYERCCAGTEHESNETDPRKHVNCWSIGGVNRVSFHRFSVEKQISIQNDKIWSARDEPVEFNS